MVLVDDETVTASSAEDDNSYEDKPGKHAPTVKEGTYR